MTPSPQDRDKLEQLIARTLRDQPPRRAPRSLEGRVLAALAQRAALPWWRQDFAHWPVAARGAFLGSSAALAAVLVWVIGGLNVAPATDAVTSSFAWLDTARGIAADMGNLTALVFRSISPVWLYGGAAAFVTLYAALFGLGAAAYRTLFANR